MSWNEPGGDKKDPWSGRGGNNTPPDLDEGIRILQEKLGKLFGGGGGHDGQGGGFSGGKGLLIIVAVVAVLWLLSGLYIVNEGSNGVITRFGKYTETTRAGLNWHLPTPIEQVQIVDVKQQRFIEVGYRSGSGQTLGSVPREALMLTEDENIVDIRLAVQYQIKDPKDYIFQLANPTATLKQITESAQRGVIGSSKMDFVLTEGRSEVVAQIKKEIQETMDQYQSGILITSVNLQDAQPPEQVQGAFEDAIKAREDKQRLINEAQAYANDVLPKARGAAARILEEAEGYKEQVIANAEGEASRFESLLTEYQKAPKVTRERLYLDTIKTVLGHANTVLVDVKNGNNLMYLPLDKVLRNVPNSSAQAVTSSNNNPTSAQSGGNAANSVFRNVERGRQPRGR
ncbi:MAG: FtsH protease activity modulator HflK [Methylococcales bacterium]|nr:FtsH protease activity modulator HflK [Methylococcales bacterium]